MKKSLVVMFVFATFIGCKQKDAEPMADQYYVNKRDACICTVQKSTERPQLGTHHLGPFDTKQKAIKAMCDNVDPTFTDMNRCWEVTPIGVCKPATVPLTAAQPVYYKHSEVVQALKQPKSNDCWATALTMLYSWKTHDNTITIKDVVKGYGKEFLDLFVNNTGISAAKEMDLYNKAGLKVIKGQNPSIKMWYDLLKNKGPLSITVDANPPSGTFHALLINGIDGDGSDKTIIEFIDPADGKQHKLKFSEFILLYEGSASWPLQIIHWP